MITIEQLRVLHAVVSEGTFRAAAEKLHKTHGNFEKTHAALLRQLDRDIEQIHQYLPNQQ